MIDLLIIKPGAQEELYQNLKDTITAIEPPLWAALLAAFIKEKGFKVKMIDAEIEADRIPTAVVAYQPRLIAIVVSGTNPSASTMNMVGARTILEEIEKQKPGASTILIGLHPSALPVRTLNEEPVKMVCQGEGFYTLWSLLSDMPLEDIKGLWYKEGTEMFSNPRAKLVNPNDLPMPAWNLLPMSKYRAHNWQCWNNIDERTPYGVIYTSLGCPFNCSFCCINAIFGKKHTIRYRDPKKIIEEIDYLVRDYNIHYFKIIDEMFDLDEKHVIDLCDLIIERNYNLNIWAYSRVDTINKRKLEKMKKAGINWLGIGFEAANRTVREGVSKGRFDNDKIFKVVQMVQDAGINVGGNFIFGLPDDNLETMQETLNLMKKINCEFANIYACIAYPGSKLYADAVQQEKQLPDSWLGYSQYSYETYPLATKHLTSKEVLKFRDYAFNEYFGSKKYQDMIESKFGKNTLKHIKEVLTHKLDRKLLSEGKMLEV